jgi:hypothetical protein
METILFLFAWTFWPIVVLLPIIAYMAVQTAAKEDSGSFAAIFLMSVVVGLLTYKYQWIRDLFTSWTSIAYVIGGYVLAGFLVSLYKWFMVLFDFKKLKEEVRAEITKLKNSGTLGDELNRVLSNHYAKCYVDVDDNNVVTIYPNWKEHPIGVWWVYWPFFILSVVFDPLKRIIENLYERLKDFYNFIAKQFSVKL